MNTKQKFILTGLILMVALISDLLMDIFRIKLVPAALIFVWTFIAGMLLGILKRKWERDKEMASLVADKLMGRMHEPGAITPDSMQRLISQANNPQVQSTGNSSQTYLNSLLGNANVSSLGKR